MPPSAVVVDAVFETRKERILKPSLSSRPSYSLSSRKRRVSKRMRSATAGRKYFGLFFLFHLLFLISSSFSALSLCQIRRGREWERGIEEGMEDRDSNSERENERVAGAVQRSRQSLNSGAEEKPARSRSHYPSGCVSIYAGNIRPSLPFFPPLGTPIRRGGRENM